MLTPADLRLNWTGSDLRLSADTPLGFALCVERSHYGRYYWMADGRHHYRQPLETQLQAACDAEKWLRRQARKTMKLFDGDK